MWPCGGAQVRELIDSGSGWEADDGGGMKGDPMMDERKLETVVMSGEP